ncbi:MAG TPA: HAD-IC family P-type ATPase, partial [Stellaceae bacterium]
IADGVICVAGDDFQRLLRIAVLCNEATVSAAQDRAASDAASPTEAALIRLALDAGIDADLLRRRHPLLGVEYRSQNRHYMVTQHRDAGRYLVAVKGNPEQVLQRCGWYRQGGRRRKLSKARRQAISAENRGLAKEGLRVLGLAYAEQSVRRSGVGDPVAARHLTWLGLVGLADPARRGVGATIAQFDRAGIRVIMMTGDQGATAEAIARQLNLANGAPAAMLEADRRHEVDARAVEGTRIFARVSPAEKLQIVRCLQRMGKVVAMTGDGINDSPALRAADVGIVMGRSGTDAARAVADVVLQSDDISAMVAVLERGRTTYGNIRKAIHFLLATNLSEILVMLTETAAGLGSPLTPIQLLWITLLSDVLPALGLALEPTEPGVLVEPPRDPDETIVRPGDMAVLAGEGATIALGALAAHTFGLWRHGAAARAGTISFTSLVGAQLLHALTCRSSRYGLFSGERLAPNRPLGATLVASAALQLSVLTLPPLRRFMGLARMDLVDALVSLACAVLPYVANEAVKALRLSAADSSKPSPASSSTSFWSAPPSS